MFVAQPGLIVGNRYSLTQVIGRGGMGEVWKAHDRELDTACAVKFILQHLASDRGIRERFAREAKAVARLRSPHVVHILGVGECENVPYLAMELLDGETLLTRLERIGRMHPAVTLKMLEQVAEALEGAHQAGIVHRDLKPDNIWFWSGNKVFVKVLDFGVAKTGMTTESLQTATGALVGTPQYMSPEQALGNRDIDHRSDLWSLAVITMECLSGKRPFESAGLGDLLMKIVGAAPPALRDLAPELPAGLQTTGLQEWWGRALARDPRDRFQSATELVDALRPHLASFEADTAHGAESARPARLAVADRSEPVVRPEPVRLESRHSEPRPAEPARSARLEMVDSLAAAESTPARAPGSVGPISSSRSPQQRRETRQRTVLIAGGLLAAAVLLTLGRLFLTAAPERDGTAASEAPAPPAALADPAKPPPSSPEPTSPEPNTAPPPSTDPATAPPGERAALDQRNPWDPALRGNPAAAPSTSAQALQPRAGNPAEPLIKPAVTVAPVMGDPSPPSPATAEPKPVPPRATPRPRAPPRPAEPAPPPEAARPPGEAAPASRDPGGESDAARKERLRKATGL